VQKRNTLPELGLHSGGGLFNFSDMYKITPILVNRENQYWMGLNVGFSNFIKGLIESQYYPTVGDLISVDGYETWEVVDRTIESRNNRMVMFLAIDWESWAGDDIKNDPYVSYEDNDGKKDIFCELTWYNREKILLIQDDILANSYGESDEEELSKKYYNLFKQE